MFRPRRILPLALALAWAPVSHAFPPCPSAPLDLIPVNDASGVLHTPSSPVWARGHYGFLGKTSAFVALPTNTPQPGNATHPESTTQPISKCHDRVFVEQDNTSNGSIALQPKYAPEAGYGLLALPELRYTLQPLNLSYTLTASIDGTSLPHAGDWIDALQLDFFWSGAESPITPGARSAVYRLRKSQSTDRTPRIRIIESRAGYPDRIVTTFLPAAANLSVPLQLRWETRTSSPGASTSSVGGTRAARHATASTAAMLDEAPGAVVWHVDSALEILDGQGTVLHRIELPGQAPNELQMGLLDYNATGIHNAPHPLVLDIDNTTLSVNPL